MAKKALDGIQDLIDRTGGSKVKATVTVDQPYAQDQHETLYYKHPRGGQAKYLETPLFSDHPKWLQKFANRLLMNGTDAADEWADVGRSLKNEVPKTAPVEFGDLRQSAALQVKEGGSIIVNEPAAQPRLTEAELDAKDYMRSMGVSYR
jgi:hypothetical protein